MHSTPLDATEPDEANVTIVIQRTNLHLQRSFYLHIGFRDVTND